jgi:hypothetical protein
MTLFGRTARIALCGIGLMTLAGCGVGETNAAGYPYKSKQDSNNVVYAKNQDDFDARQQTLFGKGGLGNIFGSKKDNGGDGTGGGGGIGVNSFLWRASLETISFMPVTAADPFGGVIITDWHTPGETPNERFKLNIYIMGKELRADGVKVAVFRQMKDASGTGWVDANTPDQTSTRIEDAILTKARQMRNSLALQ